MRTRLLISVDVRNDVCEGGALGVDGGGAVAQRIASYVRTHGGDYDRLLASQDWHRGDTDNGGHVAADPDYTDTWPVHCVAGTEVEDRVDTGESVQDLVTGCDIDVVGLAYDFCVRATVLGSCGR